MKTFTEWLELDEAKYAEKPKGQVSVDDPRYISGELVHINTNLVTVKCAITGESKGKVSVDDPRYISGELVFSCIGRTYTPETIQKMSNTRKSYYANNEHQHANKRLMKNINTGVTSWVTETEITSEHTSASSGQKTVKDPLRPERGSFNVSVNDPRYLAGELVPATTGLKYKQSTCPHCNKTGRGGNMKRYHFDNCKLKL